jgi:hypothetical protein
MKMVRNIWIFCLEPLDNRYTKQWYENIPKILNDEIVTRNLSFNVVTVDGVQSSTTATEGAFLDFTDTNYYKSSQLCKFIEYMREGKVGKSDKILFADAWNPCITQIAYMRDLMDQQWELHSIFHAGAYDPTDILGYKMKKPWPWHAERSWYYSSDYNYYATDFHKKMFLKNLTIDSGEFGRAVRSGQPHTPIIEQCSQYWHTPKNGKMIWPHRYNADKQPEIAEEIALTVPTIITQKMNLSKADYYKALGESSVMFSCSLHENLGISIMEGALAGVIPILPDRCSYSEMYLPEFIYPSAWTKDYESFLIYKPDLLAFINDRIENRSTYLPALQKQCEILIEKYLTPTVMVNKLLGS